MTDYPQLAEKIRSLSCEVFENEILAPYTSFRIGGACKLLVKPRSITQIADIIAVLREVGSEYMILGNGSNVLVADKGYNGVIILCSNTISGIQLLNETTIECETGVTLTKLCNFACAHSLSGLEFAFGIPGTVGGGIYMNAGAYGGEIKDCLVSCTYLDEENQLCIKTAKELGLSYRHSFFTDRNCCILKATFRLEKEKQVEIKNKMEDYILRRKSKQPLEYPSGGSTFKRPTGNYASALIEQCGLKGLSVGGAMVSEKHSGFIINYDKATCADVLDLISKVKKIVFEKTGYQLECEIKTLGI